MGKVIQFPGHQAKRGYAPPRRKWDDVCKWCSGSGFVQGLHAQEPCEGCTIPENHEPAEDTWPSFIRAMIEDRFGSNAWNVLRLDRAAQHRAYMVVDWIFRQITPIPDAAERFRLLFESIPANAGNARKLAWVILDERRDTA